MQYYPDDLASYCVTAHQEGSLIELKILIGKILKKELVAEEQAKHRLTSP